MPNNLLLHRTLQQHNGWNLLHPFQDRRFLGLQLLGSVFGSLAHCAATGILHPPHSLLLLYWVTISKCPIKVDCAVYCPSPNVACTSGQSVPNREDIKVELGVKIYFDAVETAARVEINKSLIRKVYHDGDAVIRKWKPDAVEMLVWHVAAHEVGHAIYNLESVNDIFTVPGYKTLLEEPRAELTAMFTLKLLFEQAVLDRAKLDEALAHFALDALRYFDKYDSEAMRPYCIFQCFAHKVQPS